MRNSILNSLRDSISNRMCNSRVRLCCKYAIASSVACMLHVLYVFCMYVTCTLICAACMLDVCCVHVACMLHVCCSDDDGFSDDDDDDGDDDDGDDDGDDGVDDYYLEPSLRAVQHLLRT